MSKDWVKDIHAMHEKYGVNEKVSRMDPEWLREFLNFRINFLREEFIELKVAETPEDIVDALIDLCVVAIGTLDAFQVNSHEAWDRVLKANMAKTSGIKPTRPNPLGLPDLIKPEGWQEPRHDDNLGLLELVDIFSKEG